MTALQIQTSPHPLRIEFPWVRTLTPGEFYQFCLANQELRIERTATGDLIVTPPAFADTGNRNFNLAVQLGVWAEYDGQGLGFDSSAGFTLPNGAIRSPDAAWISLERWHKLTDTQKSSFAPICPDFVIELRSASDGMANLQQKMTEYLANGARLGWLIDRQNRQVWVYRFGQEPVVLSDPERVYGDPELSGFELVMAKIW